MPSKYKKGRDGPGLRNIFCVDLLRVPHRAEIDLFPERNDHDEVSHGDVSVVRLGDLGLLAVDTGVGDLHEGVCPFPSPQDGRVPDGGILAITVDDLSDENARIAASDDHALVVVEINHRLV